MKASAEFAHKGDRHKYVYYIYKHLGEELTPTNWQKFIMNYPLFLFWRGAS